MPPRHGSTVFCLNLCTKFSTPLNTIEVSCSGLAVAAPHYYRALENMSSSKAVPVEADGDHTDGTSNRLLARGRMLFDRDICSQIYVGNYEI